MAEVCNLISSIPLGKTFLTLYSVFTIYDMIIIHNLTLSQSLALCGAVGASKPIMQHQLIITDLQSDYPSLTASL